MQTRLTPPVRATHAVTALADKQLARLTDSSDYDESLDREAVESIGMPELSLALSVLADATQDRCIQACLDGEPREAGLVLIHAFNLALEGEKARLRALDASYENDTSSEQ